MVLLTSTVLNSRLHGTILNILLLHFLLLSFPQMPTSNQEYFTNICLLFYLNKMNICLCTCTKFTGLRTAFKWLLYIYSWCLAPNSSFIFNYFFLFFSAKHISKWHWLDNHKRILNKSMLCFVFRTNKHIAGLYRCHHIKAKKIRANLYSLFTLSLL